MDDRPFPTAAIIGGGLLMLTTVVGVGTIQLTKHFSHAAPTVEIDPGTPVKTRALRFVDENDGINAYAGHVRVFDAQTGAELPQLRDNDGFIRAVLNSLVFERTKTGVGGPPVFDLVEWSTNKITLEDRTTGKHIDVGEFGSGNKAVFLRFFHQKAAKS